MRALEPLPTGALGEIRRRFPPNEMPHVIGKFESQPLFDGASRFRTVASANPETSVSKRWDRWSVSGIFVQASARQRGSFLPPAGTFKRRAVGDWPMIQVET